MRRMIPKRWLAPYSTKLLFVPTHPIPPPPPQTCPHTYLNTQLNSTQPNPSRQFEVQRLSNELASHTRVAKREHPLEPVIHLVDEQGSGRPGGHMGRTASMATATALSSLQPRRKHDEMAQRVIRMFKVCACVLLVVVACWWWWWWC